MCIIQLTRLFLVTKIKYSETRVALGFETSFNGQTFHGDLHAVCMSIFVTSLGTYTTRVGVRIAWVHFNQE